MPSPKKKRPSPPKPPAIDSITVRMFCAGLGDCFLLQFPQPGNNPFNVLIDLGVAKGTPDSARLMKDVVATIGRLTDGVIDLLVITHEHWDHVSGFNEAVRELEALTIRHQWLAWTEDPLDPVARELSRDRRAARVALAGAARLVAQPAYRELPDQQHLVAGLEGVLAFFGPAAGVEGNSLDRAMATARRLTERNGPNTVDYLRPGTVRALPGLPGGVKSYVLGPPASVARIRDIHPGKRHPETYPQAGLLGVTPAASWTWRAALGASADEAVPPAMAAATEQAMPFDRRWRIPWPVAARQTFFQDHYFRPNVQGAKRRIDGDWLQQGAERLALQLDADTNNTSLVLAFELPRSKKVLLFAGDAQVGNWLSWHDHEFRPTAGVTVKARELLERTVLYKVGHHGSHNATLRALGLELMTHPDLVAMLPVDAASVRRLRYGEMPLKSLVEALRARTAGRVLKLDEPWTNSGPPGDWRRRTPPRRVTSPGRVPYMELVIPDA